MDEKIRSPLRGSSLPCCSCLRSFVPCLLATEWRSASSVSWLHILAFAAVPVITVFVVLEMEYPQAGFLIFESRYDQFLVDLRNSMR